MGARAKILISQDVTGTGIETLKTKYEVINDPDLWKKVPELERAAEEVDALIIRNQTKITPTLMNRAKDLKVIARAGAGYDNIYVPSASLAGVVVSFSPEENAVSGPSTSRRSCKCWALRSARSSRPAVGRPWNASWAGPT